MISLLADARVVVSLWAAANLLIILYVYVSTRQE